MAEIAGAVISVASVVGIFQDCLQCFEQIKYGQRFGEDYENALLVLETSRLRLTRWAKAIGLQEPEALRNVFSEKELKIMDRVLGQILVAFEQARGSSDVMEMVEGKEALATIPSDQKLSKKMEKLYRSMKKINEDRQRMASFAQKARWAFYERTHFNELVQRISGHIDMLDKTFPQSQPKQATLAKEDIKNMAHSVEEAKMVSKAASQTDKLLEAAAEEVINQYEGNEYRDIRVSGSNAVFGDDIAWGVRTGGSVYSGLVIENGSNVRAGNIYRGQGFTRAGQYGIEGVFGVPPRRSPNAFARRKSPDGPEVEEFDSGTEEDVLAHNPFLLDRKRTDTGLRQSGRSNTGAQWR